MILSDYTSLILHQHRDKPHFVDVVSAPILALIEWIDELTTAVEKIDIDNAEAPYLDIVGAWVGKLRGSLPNQPVDDDLYQLILRAKIIANHWDGSTEQLYDVWDTIFQGSHKLIVQDIGTMRILIALLGEASGFAYYTTGALLEIAPLTYADIDDVIIMTAVLDGTWHTSIIYASATEPIPAEVEVTNLTQYTGNLHCYIVTEPSGGKVNYYNVYSPESWATLSAYLTGVTLIAEAQDVFVQDSVTGIYAFTMPAGWEQAEDIGPIVWGRPPIMTQVSTGWSPMTADELAMLIEGHIVPQASGVEIVEYATLPSAGKMLGVDIENEYFAGIGNIETGAGGGLIAEESYT